MHRGRPHQGQINLGTSRTRSGNRPSRQSKQGKRNRRSFALGTSRMEHGSEVSRGVSRPTDAELSCFWDTFPARDRVVQLGLLSHLQKLDFFAGIDVFCLPLRSDSFGLVLLEAWANGKPVIAYRAGGPADLIHHGEDGLQIPCGDLEGLAEGMLLLEHDPSLRVEWGEIGRKARRRSFAG